MKIVFHTPVAIAELAPDTAMPKADWRGHIFAPLSALAIYENRIDVTVKGTTGPRKYPYKRFDESVN